MSHEVESMFYVGKTPWHGIGTELQNAPTTYDAIVTAKLNWTVSTYPMHYLDAQGSQQTCISKAVIRDSDGRKLGEVGPRWTALQNCQAFEWFDPFVTSGLASLETAGSLFNGERIFILAKIKGEDDVIVKESDDRVCRYVLLSNGHDGKLAVRVGFTPIRVVCNNTLGMAHRNNASKLLRIRHTRNVNDTLEQVREVMNLANAEFETTVEQYRKLASTTINTNDLQKYVKLVFKKNSVESETSEKETDDELSRVEEKVTELFETGIGANLQGVHGTLWGAYNAITEFLTWHRGRSQDRRLDQLWFGAAATLSQKALHIGTDFEKLAA